MFISFGVENYRSFGEEQTLLMSAGTKASANPKFVLKTGNDLAPNVLRSTVLYGANASGKSSFIKAISFLQEKISIINNSGGVNGYGRFHDEKGTFKTTPFKLDPDYLESPSKFEISFIAEDSLYQYGFEIFEDFISGEWLYRKPNLENTRIRTVFERFWDFEHSEYIWKFGKSELKGRKESWKDATAENDLFLTVASYLKSEALTIPHRWLMTKLNIHERNPHFPIGATASGCENQARKEKILEILSGFDFPIVDFEITKKTVADDELPHEFLNTIPEEFRKDILEDIRHQMQYSAKTYHLDTHGNKISFEMREESDGTQWFFAILGPWLDAIEKGQTIIVDELGGNLHPLMLGFLVGLFNDDELNRNGAQLIFTAHETSVMDKKFMHPEQIWFVSKGESGNSELHSLSSYKIRERDSYQKPYLDGRFGAIPILRNYRVGSTTPETEA